MYRHFEHRRQFAGDRDCLIGWRFDVERLTNEYFVRIKEGKIKVITDHVSRHLIPREMGAAPTGSVTVSEIHVKLISYEEGHILVAAAEAVAGSAVDVIHCEYPATVIIEWPIDGDAAARVGASVYSEIVEGIDAALKSECAAAGALIERTKSTVALGTFVIQIGPQEGYKSGWNDDKGNGERVEVTECDAANGLLFSATRECD